MVLAAVVAFLVVVVVTQQTAGAGLVQSAGAANATATAAASASAASTAKPLAVQVARNQSDDTMAWGDINAPLVIVQWTDLRCPYCAAFATQTMPTLFANYVDTGKVRFELHDAAFFGDQSVDAAVAARAAGAQGRYHEYISALYAAAPSSGHPDLPKAKLIGFAEQAQVPDIAKFTAALSDATLRKQVTDSTTAAQTLGVTSVPFFVIGDQVVSGAQPLANFTSTIETELAKK